MTDIRVTREAVEVLTSSNEGPPEPNPFTYFLSTYSINPWSNGVNTSIQNATFLTDGSLAGLLDSSYLDMIIVSKTGGAVIQATTISNVNTFAYTLLDGTTNTEVQDNLENPLPFKILIKDVDPASEWFYYDAGGAYPFVPPVVGGVGVIRTISINYVYIGT